jgi:hypothetical protein
MRINLTGQTGPALESRVRGKRARPVRRGAHGKGRQRTSPGAYPTVRSSLSPSCVDTTPLRSGRLRSIALLRRAGAA